MRRFVLAFIGSLLWISAAHAKSGDTVELQALPAVQNAQQRSIWSSYEQRSDGIVPGKGGYLHLLYTSSVPLHAYITPFNGRTTYNPQDTLTVILPAGTKQTAYIDLTAGPAWTPLQNNYNVTFLSDSADATPEFFETTFLPIGFFGTAKMAFVHFFTPLPYVVSSYHLLLSYRILGLSVTFLFGCLALLTLMIVTLVRRGKDPVSAIFLTVIVFQLLYQSRSALDLLRYTVRHVSAWAGEAPYEAADDMYQVIPVFQAQAAASSRPVRLVICHDTTDYYAKLLRYFLYPIPVESEANATMKATHVLVSQKNEWTYEGGVLTCGSLKVSAKKIQEFNAGSVLFSL